MLFRSGDGGVALGIMPKTLWGKFYPSDSENKILFDTNTLLIQTPKEKILVELAGIKTQAEE